MQDGPPRFRTAATGRARRVLPLRRRRGCRWAAADGRCGHRERPASVGDLITTLIAALSEQRDHLRAAAIVADVRLPETGSDAIRVTLEHSERIALTVLLPYKTRRFGRAIDYGDLQTEAAAAFIWPS